MEAKRSQSKFAYRKPPALPLAALVFLDFVVLGCVCGYDVWRRSEEVSQIVGWELTEDGFLLHEVPSSQRGRRILKFKKIKPELQD